MVLTKKQGRLLVFFVLLVLALLATVPFLKKDFLFADDWLFHFNRIIGIAEGLKSGQFPVRIYPQVYDGAGYQAPLYYPDFFLYIPGILVVAGMPVLGAVYLFHFLINFFTSFFAWFAMRRMKASVLVSLMMAGTWCFCPYRLSDLYSRYALGETLALCFLPLVVAGFYEIFLSEQPRIMLLVFAMSGVILSHVLSVLFALGFLLVFLCLFADRLVKNPKTLLFLIEAGLLTFLLTAFFLIPFMEADRENTMVAGMGKNVWDEAVGFKDFLFPITLQDEKVFFVGFSAYLFLAAAVIFLIREKGFGLRKRFILCLTGFGIFLLWMCTYTFPWEAICQGGGRLGSLLRMIQFPWRLIGPGCLMLFLAGGLSIHAERMKGRTKVLLAAAVASCCMCSFIPYCVSYPEDREAVLSFGEEPSTGIAWEYLYFNTYPNAMHSAEPIPSEATEIRSYHQNGTNLDLVVSAPEDGWIDTTLFKYVGYEAYDAEGNRMVTTFGGNNRLRILFEKSYDGAVRVCYKGRLHWSVWTAVSLLTLFFCVIICVRHRKGSSGSDEEYANML